MKTKLLLFATLLRSVICFAQSCNIPDVKEQPKPDGKEKPKMHVRKTAVLFALLVSLAAASASAATINFASLQASSPDPEVPGALTLGTSSYTQQGLTIGTCCVKSFDVWKLGNSNFPGTSPAATSLFNYPVTGNTTQITYNGGQPFTLDSIDFAPLLRGGSGSFTFWVTGDCGDGCTVSQPVTISNSARLQTVRFSGFTNVLAVTFSQGTIAGSLGQPTAQQETAYQFNNIVVNNRYVDGGKGRDSNDCLSVQTACQTITHAIALASSGDSIVVAGLASPATYKEHLTIGKSLNVLGAGASTTIVDGAGVATVVSVSAAAHVTLSGLTIRNGSSSTGAGIYNSGSLAVYNSTVTGNHVSTCGGGIGNNGTLTINNSTISGNSASANGGGICQTGGTLTINNSTISGNSASVNGGGICQTGGTLMINNSTIGSTFLGNSADGSGGGIYNGGTLTISNATIYGNRAINGGGGIDNLGAALINNSTISKNSAHVGGGIDGPATLQNSIVASNSSGGNCSGTIVSNGYNLSSDHTCNFNKIGDLNNTDPLLGPLQNNGGPTQTRALLPGSPAIDAGNPTGCTDGHGHLLKTDQRGQPRPDKEDTGGCDMGAYEKQSD